MNINKTDYKLSDDFIKKNMNLLAPTKKTRKIRTKSVKRRQRGGTSITSNYYNLSSTYPQSTDAFNSSYGTIKLGDVGTTLLAPFNNNVNSKGVTMIKTGGKKIKRGGEFTVPKMNTSILDSLNNVVSTSVNAIDKTIKMYKQGIDNINTSYSNITTGGGKLKKQKKSKSIKIANKMIMKGRKMIKMGQNTIKKGISKLKKFTSTKKSKTKKQKKIKQRGSSDWISSVNSRAIDGVNGKYLGVDEKYWFSQYANPQQFISSNDLKNGCF